MQNELSPMQNQESFTDLTLDGAQVYLANVCGKSLTPDARLALNVKKKTPNNIFLWSPWNNKVQATSNSQNN